MHNLRPKKIKTMVLFT